MNTPKKNHYILGNGNPKKNISGSNFPSSKKNKRTHSEQTSYILENRTF